MNLKHFWAQAVASAPALGFFFTVSAALAGVMWKTMQWLWKLALKQAQQETMDDLLTVKSMTAEWNLKFDDHAESDKQHFDAINANQNQLLEDVREIKGLVTDMAQKQAVTANDVSWLKNQSRK